ncbi:hypothetical protein YpsIP31758_0934 [Yersinia pseudotuberculosis IP 31758]|uniref:Uncharacterized protein n=1 Tax=Yersinia pseudotuberculosis serotype O:1b (strain IP 31758) TaxID=349747 RepID=A0A0U1QY46_YERP3|nr:hypothetical protein YpsIP31758_0934 [Yersinia pseudotuberculosis IP 31758]
MARLEPTWMYLRRLYDLPVLSVAGTLSITSRTSGDVRQCNKMNNTSRLLSSPANGQTEQPC